MVVKASNRGNVCSITAAQLEVHLKYAEGVLGAQEHTLGI